MAIHTAQIIVGNEDPNNRGLHHPVNSILLSEGSRPCWYISTFAFRNPSIKKYKLIPTTNHTIDDGILFLSISFDLLEEQSIFMKNLISDIRNKHWIEMYSYTEKQRENLYAECRNYSINFPEMIITIFGNQSLLSSQIDQVKNYNNKIVVLSEHSS